MHGHDFTVQANRQLIGYVFRKTGNVLMLFK